MCSVLSYEKFRRGNKRQTEQWTRQVGRRLTNQSKAGQYHKIHPTISDYEKTCRGGRWGEKVESRGYVAANG